MGLPTVRLVGNTGGVRKQIVEGDSKVEVIECPSISAAEVRDTQDHVVVGELPGGELGVQLTEAVRERICRNAPTLLVGKGCEIVAPSFAKETKFIPQWLQTTCSPQCKLIKPDTQLFFATTTLHSIPSGWAGVWTTQLPTPILAAAEKVGFPCIAAVGFAMEWSGLQGRAYLAKWIAQKEGTKKTEVSRLSIGASAASEGDVREGVSRGCDFIYATSSSAVSAAQKEGLPIYTASLEIGGERLCLGSIVDGVMTYPGTAVTAAVHTKGVPAGIEEGAFLIVENLAVEDLAEKNGMPSLLHIVVAPKEVSLWKGTALMNFDKEFACRLPPSGMQYKSLNLQCVVPTINTESVSSFEKDMEKSVVGSICVEITETTKDDVKTAVSAMLKEYNTIMFSPDFVNAEEAMTMLNHGAAKVVVSSAAFLEDVEEVSKIPRSRILAMLPADQLLSRSTDLTNHVDGFVIDLREQDLDLTQISTFARHCAALTPRASLSVKLSQCSQAVVSFLDDLGVQCFIASDSFDTKFPLSACVTGMVKTDRSDALIPTVVCDHGSGRVLGMCYSNKVSLHEAVTRRRGIYWSRNRGLWVKGETSGDVQELVKVETDCDRDCLLFTVKQTGAGFCHREQKSCFGPAKVWGFLLSFCRITNMIS